jgi:hypothetical protein
MMAFWHWGGKSEEARLAHKAHALVSLYDGSGVLPHVLNFAGGVIIGCMIVVFFWLTVG